MWGRTPFRNRSAYRWCAGPDENDFGGRPRLRTGVGGTVCHPAPNRSHPASDRRPMTDSLSLHGATADGAVVGYVEGVPDNEAENVAHLYRIYVHPDHWGDCDLPGARTRPRPSRRPLRWAGSFRRPDALTASPGRQRGTRRRLRPREFERNYIW
ncbi:GNAT family N-acetyltransferase [Haloarchaeobius salinus]|uniref:GNAT family N-acetyltransferase n=1 Tax=Haloarchaeobius salinus TaxID=1198298 RepID=UPI0034A5CC39